MKSTHKEYSSSLEIIKGAKINLPGKPRRLWIGELNVLLNSNRTVVFNGPGDVPVKIEYKNCERKELKYSCLYVGKSINIKK